MVYYVHDLTLDAVSFVLPRPYDRRLLIVSGPQDAEPVVQLLRGVQGDQLWRVVMAAINGDRLDLPCGGFDPVRRRRDYRVHSAAGALYCTEQALQQLVGRFTHAVIARARLMGLAGMDERSLGALSRAVGALDLLIGGGATPVPVAREYSESSRH